MPINKEIVARNFGKFAKNYDKEAFIQKKVAEKLANIVEENCNISLAKDVIDLGAGTGFLSRNILKKHPNQEISQFDLSPQILNENQFTPQIIGDIDNLPFSPNSFDLILSSLALQWSSDLAKTIKNIRKTLKNNGLFFFSIIGDNTFKELKLCMDECQIKLNINKFFTRQCLEKICPNSEIISEDLIFNYENLTSLLKSIKNIGASYSAQKNFLKKSDLQKISDFYLKTHSSGNKNQIIATWQIFYVFCKK